MEQDFPARLQLSYTTHFLKSEDICGFYTHLWWENKLWLLKREFKKIKRPNVHRIYKSYSIFKFLVKTSCIGAGKSFLTIFKPDLQCLHNIWLKIIIQINFFLKLCFRFILPKVIFKSQDTLLSSFEGPQDGFFSLSSGGYLERGG